MQARDVIEKILANKINAVQTECATAFAPTNIALCKYWGKRDSELNIPDTTSLSIALPDKGVITTLRPNEQNLDQVWLNGQLLNPKDKFVTRLVGFLDLFRPKINTFLDIETVINIPVSAGLASSACGFAAFVLALNDLFGWQLSAKELSILARLGSGSASRSLWSGFVEWHAGTSPDGMDSYAKPINDQWPELRVGLLILTTKEKAMGSRQAMSLSKQTSPFYSAWIKQCKSDLKTIHKAIQIKDFDLLGTTAERNAVAMHATAMTSYPSIIYSNADTLATVQKIWHARANGLSLYFTQDAGPNIKLLFLDKDTDAVRELFPEVDMISPFVDTRHHNEVVLVDKQDRAHGHAEKLAAHEHALCHRAISVFIFRHHNGQLETLLQQRSFKKIHSGGLWTNTSCSHPRLSEHVFHAAHRRLKEEMGMHCQLIPRGIFHYIAPFGNGLTEHEVDHVFIGFYDGSPIKPDPEEVESHQWVAVNELNQELKINPQKYTAWFKQALDIAIGDHYQSQL